MDPVMRALQSIADIDSETRELGQFEPASACRTTRFETTTYASCGQSVSPVVLEGNGSTSSTKRASCGAGSQCECTATSYGNMFICGSTYPNAWAAWNYTITDLTVTGGY